MVHSRFLFHPLKLFSDVFHLTKFSINSYQIWLNPFVCFVDDEGTKWVKRMILYSRNIDIIYPEIDVDSVAGSRLNNRD